MAKKKHPGDVVSEAAFRRYVRTQHAGRFNMLSPEAAASASLTREEHVAILDHYDYLSAKYPNVIKEFER